LHGELKIHIESVHEKLRPFQCTICSKCFSQKRSLRAHLQAIHEKA
jgi:uncharacterized Zn-finger protein